MPKGQSLRHTVCNDRFTHASMNQIRNIIVFVSTGLISQVIIYKDIVLVR